MRCPVHAAGSRRRAKAYLWLIDVEMQVSWDRLEHQISWVELEPGSNFSTGPCLATGSVWTRKLSVALSPVWAVSQGPPWRPNEQMEGEWDRNGLLNHLESQVLSCTAENIAVSEVLAEFCFGASKMLVRGVVHP